MIAFPCHILLAVLAGSVVTPLWAQVTDESALDQFEQTRPAPRNDSPASVELRDAVRRMAQRPTDPVALSDAGYASLKLGDAAAALNFFTRANAVQPNNPRTLAGMGSALVRTENPFEALKYFDDAVKLGASERSIALDRALAFDLLGNFARAHQDYQLAQGFGDPDELVRRHAMSLSMAGKGKEADGLLVPLLQRNDPEAWRARAFMLAARGEQKEAIQIAEGFLSPDAARRMEGYLRQMPRMTDAQRAAAMHFGHFPVGRIGEDTAEVKRLASTTVPVRTATAPTGQDRLIPAGDPFGSNTSKKQPDRKADPAKESKATKNADLRQAKKDAAPGFSTASAQRKIEEAAKAKPVMVAAASLPPPDAARAPVRVTLPPAIMASPSQVAMPTAASGTPSVANPNPQTAIEAVRARQQTGGNLEQGANLPPANEREFAVAPPTGGSTVAIADAPPAETDLAVTADISKPKPAEPVVSTPIIAQSDLPTPVQGPELDAQPSTPKIDLGALVQAIEIPESEQRPTVAAVDLKAIERAKPKVEVGAAAPATKDTKAVKPKVEPKTPPQPARIWVQVATGAEAALGGDFRRFAKKSPELFKGKEGWTSVWGKSSRLLVGPFANAQAAKKWDADYRKAGGSSFVWNSENGTVVKKLGAK